LCIATGIALIVLPGPLTIPPILLGLWIWSREFEFAHRFLEQFKTQGEEAWEAAKRKPVTTGLVTAAGLVGAGVAVWALLRYDLVAKATEAVGL
jgi:uncharacterized membrane protein YbaN (DUF454 family)